MASISEWWSSDTCQSLSKGYAGGFSRRSVLGLGAGVAALNFASPSALALTYPDKSVRIVVGLGAGSASDIITRLVGQRLSERLGKPFVVENRPGASGTLAAEAVVHSSPNGYTLLLANSADAVDATLNKTLSFNIIRDTVAIASIASGPLVQVVNPSFPARTIPEFIAYAKANPGKISFGSAGTGSLVHLAGEMFKVMAGVDMVHVPYRGGMVPALTDLISGQVQVVFSTLPPAIGHIRAGGLRALAVTSAKRSAALPDLPTVGEFLPGYEAIFANGLAAARGTPAYIVDKLNKETNTVLAESGITARLASLGTEPMPMTPADFSKFRADEVEKWAKVIHAAHIKL